ncbi:DUF2784 domain-containing protein [Kangiella shandongensis]|uniref:DUF2784 domain-containing protein n=1 Tax=Kangiella shandongensis TaxID=2763258 RepID=UPI001CBC27C8|nr:DUF2784 domain-containing protein [Kangiella shandongensis]
MNESNLFQWLADIVLILHMSLVLFVVGGLVLIVIGNLRHWDWVNRLWFRLVHLAIVVVVIAEVWLGLVCPLTTLEIWLRQQAGGDTYQVGFVEHWVQQILYWDLPTWVFTVAYSTFGLLVLLVWIIYPPHFRKSNSKKK